jgi:ferrous iron transport protein B
MLVGFGCNVPGIMATRTLECRRDRIMAILMNPFMSCGARLPVYTLFAAAFFPENGGTVIFAIYITGIVLAVMTGLLFKKTLLQGEVTSFVMELPPYHLPTISGVLYHTWHRLKSFIIKAGKVILLIVAVLGFLNSMGTDGSFGNNDSENSVLSAMSKAVTPVFQPMGIEEENWPATVGMFTGIFAKEAVVGTLDSIYSQMDSEQAALDAAVAGEVAESEFDFWGGVIEAFGAIPDGYEGFWEGLKDPLGLSGAVEEVQSEEDTARYASMVGHFGEHGKASAFAYLLFILIYSPCVAALAAIGREIGMRWMFFAMAYLTVLAWVVSTIYYQLATFSVHPSSSALWLGIAGAIAVVSIVGMRIAGNQDVAKEC